MGGAAPAERPTGRFEWLEVIQVVEVEGRWALVFSCLAAEMPGAAAGSGGVWSVPVDGPGSPVDVAAAVRLTDEWSYVGKVVQHRRRGVLPGLPQPGRGRRVRRGTHRSGAGRRGAPTARGLELRPVTHADGRWLLNRSSRGFRRAAERPSVTGVTYNGSSGTFLPVRR